MFWFTHKIWQTDYKNGHDFPPLPEKPCTLQCEFVALSIKRQSMLPQLFCLVCPSELSSIACDENDGWPVLSLGLKRLNISTLLEPYHCHENKFGLAYWRMRQHMEQSRFVLQLSYSQLSHKHLRVQTRSAEPLTQHTTNYKYISLADPRKKLIQIQEQYMLQISWGSQFGNTIRPTK